MRKLYILTFFLLLSTVAAFGQQYPQYSMYMFNGLVLNPAYAGSRENVSMVGILRRQWVGLDGGPATESFSIHGPSRNLRHGFGATIYNDKVGVEKQFNVNFSYAYRILTGENSALSLGLSGEMNNYRLDMAEAFPNDPTLAANSINVWQPNVGTGVYFNSRRLYVGASIPHLLENNRYDGTTNGVTSTQVRHYLLTGGIVLGGKAVKFKPSTLIKVVPGSPLSVDLNGSFLFADKLWLGASWRLKDAVAVIFEWQVTNAFRFGYAYDFGISDLRPVHSGSHEFMLGIDFRSRGKGHISPRYF